MTTYNVYEAKTNFSRILAMVQNGERVVIAKNGQPVADIAPHMPTRNPVKFGSSADKFHYCDEDFEGLDPDIQEMFYGKNWDEA